MMKRIKVISVAMVFILSFGTVVNASAQKGPSTLSLTDIDGEFVETLFTNEKLLLESYDNILEIQEVDVSDVQSNYVVATEIDEVGDVTVLDCDMSLKRVEVKVTDNDTVNYAIQDHVVNVYVLSAETTNSENELAKDGIELKGIICWIDNFGWNNTFQYVTGEVGGSYANAHYQYGPSGGLYNDDYFVDSFTDTKGADEKAMRFYLFLAADSKTTSKHIRLDIWTSIFDTPDN